MPNPVVPSNLADRFRPLTVDEEGIAQALIDDAWAIVLAVVPDIESRMSAGSTSTDVVRFVVTSMALRVLRNPNGVRSWSVDDYSETRDNAISAGALYVSEPEIALLMGTARRRPGAFSIGAAREPCPAPGAERDAVELEYLRSGWRSGYSGYCP